MLHSVVVANNTSTNETYLPKCTVMLQQNQDEVNHEACVGMTRPHTAILSYSSIFL